MATDGWTSALRSAALAGVGAFVLLALALGRTGWGAAAGIGVLTFVVGWALAAWQDAEQRDRPAPVLALAVLALAAPATCFAASVWVGLGTSRAAGGWLLRAAEVGATCAAVGVVLSLVAPRARDVAVGLCGVCVAVPMVVGVVMGVVALRTDERVQAAAAGAPLPGPGRPATVEERVGVAEGEQVEAVRAWSGAGLTCAELGRRFERWTGRPPGSTRATPTDVDAPCRFEHVSAWLGRRAELRSDGTVVVAAWSPTRPPPWAVGMAPNRVGR